MDMLLCSFLYSFTLPFLASASSPNSNSTTKPRYPEQRGRNYDYISFDPDQTNVLKRLSRCFASHGTMGRNSSGWSRHCYPGEQTDIVETILDFIPTIDFTGTDTPKPSPVSLFETNIRYLGGLLSAYDLLQGPFRHLKIGKKKVDALLTQATTLADTLKYAFDMPSGIPINNIFIENKTFIDDRLTEGKSQINVPAAMGNLVLEWQRLSDLTSHTQYGGWTSGNDSAYEHLIKLFVYCPGRFSHYGERFTKAADSTIKHILSHPSSRPDLSMATTFAGLQQVNYTEFLACFIARSFILGSSAVDRSDWLDYGLSFSECCANGYRYMAPGFGPTLYSWDTDLLTQPENSDQTDLYSRTRFFILDGAFAAGQSPEAVESWYYAYQHTQLQYWRDAAWAYTLTQNSTMRIVKGLQVLTMRFLRLVTERAAVL